jgi:hypothetical protein
LSNERWEQQKTIEPESFARCAVLLQEADILHKIGVHLLKWTAVDAIVHSPLGEKVAQIDIVCCGT